MVLILTNENGKKCYIKDVEHADIKDGCITFFIKPWEDRFVINTNGLRIDLSNDFELDEAQSQRLVSNISYLDMVTVLAA